MCEDFKLDWTAFGEKTTNRKSLFFSSPFLRRAPSNLEAWDQRAVDSMCFSCGQLSSRDVHHTTRGGFHVHEMGCWELLGIALDIVF